MPGGRDIAYAGTYFQTLHVVRADGGEAPREILKGQLANGVWSSFSVHPDGRIGLFGINAAGQIGFYLSDRDRVRLGSSSSVKVLPDAWRSCYVRARWNGSGDTVYVEAAPAGVSAIWRVPVDPVTQAWGTPVLLTTRLASAEFAAVSPDGSRVAFTSAQINIRAWVFPFDADRATPPGKGRPITDEDAAAFGISASADGSSVFYAEGRPGRAVLPGVRVSVDTGETTVLVDDVPNGLVASPNGRSVSYLLQRPPGAPPLSPDLDYALAWRGADGRERLLTPWERVILIPTDVRPDDRGVLATQLTQGYGGPAQLVEVSAGPAGAPRRVLLDAARKQFWQGHYSPDGRRVAFVVTKPRGGWSDRARDRAVRQQQLVSMDADRRRSRLARQAPVVARRRYALLPVARGRGLLRPVGRADRSRPRCAGRSSVPGRAVRLATVPHRFR